jgi:flagellar protein FliL
MAEDELNVDEESGEGEEQGEKKKLPIKWIIIGAAALLIIGGGILGWFIFTGSGEKDAPKKPTISSRTGFGTIFPLEVFVVNLNDPGGKRYLKTKIELEFVQDGFEEELSKRLPQIRDVTLLLLSNKSIDHVRGIDGKIALRNELIKKINQILETGKIRNLYFTEFVIQ